MKSRMVTIALVLVAGLSLYAGALLLQRNGGSSESSKDAAKPSKEAKPTAWEQAHAWRMDAWRLGMYRDRSQVMGQHRLDRQQTFH